MDNKVYVVMFHGDYNDPYPVQVFTSKEQAQSFVEFSCEDYYHIEEFDLLNEELGEKLIDNLAKELESDN